MEEKKHFHYDSVIKLSDVKKNDEKISDEDINITKISFLVPARIEYFQDGLIKSTEGSVDLINRKVYFKEFNDISDLFFEALSTLTKISPNEYVIPTSESVEIMENADKKIKEYHSGSFNE